MPQLFHRSANSAARMSILAVVILATLGLTVVFGGVRSPNFTNQYLTRNQPIQFSHKHHVGDDGIDCRYCHTGVETSAVAGIPPTRTCMNCHSVLYNNVGYLAPVRESYSTDTSIQWVKVHRLADYVYFNHSIHVNKGVGCTTCHGAINQMPLVFQANTLQMSWCLDCHRNPEKVLREQKDVFNVNWKPGPDQEEKGKVLATQYNIRSVRDLTSCSTCHR